MPDENGIYILGPLQAPEGAPESIDDALDKIEPLLDSALDQLRILEKNTVVKIDRVKLAIATRLLAQLCLEVEKLEFENINNQALNDIEQRINMLVRVIGGISHNDEAFVKTCFDEARRVLLQAEYILVQAGKVQTEQNTIHGLIVTNLDDPRLK